MIDDNRADVVECLKTIYLFHHGVTGLRVGRQGCGIGGEKGASTTCLRRKDDVVEAVVGTCARLCGTFDGRDARIIRVGMDAH